MWRTQFAALANCYRLIAFDRRGFGLSTGRPAIEDDLADIERLLAQIGIERVAIVGMSQGARIALRWALGFRHRTACLVLDGPPRGLAGPVAGRLQGEIPIADYRELILREGIDAFRKQWLNHPFMRLHTNDASTHALLREIIDRYPGHDLLADDAPQSSRGDLRLLDLPALVVNGECDSDERRAAGAELAHALPNARRVVIEDAGHLPNLDNPSAYNGVLGEFFGRQLASAPGSHESSSRWSTQHAQ
jgi:pimeloyl-ACP methyl ester carboxylesterase